LKYGLNVAFFAKKLSVKMSNYIATLNIFKYILL